MTNGIFTPDLAAQDVWDVLRHSFISLVENGSPKTIREFQEMALAADTWLFRKRMHFHGENADMEESWNARLVSAPYFNSLKSDEPDLLELKTVLKHLMMDFGYIHSLENQS